MNAREHPVFRELTRVKQYFDKLKVAETGPAAPSTKLDREAAGRFIKHALVRLLDLTKTSEINRVAGRE